MEKREGSNAFNGWRSDTQHIICSSLESMLLFAVVAVFRSLFVDIYCYGLYINSLCIHNYFSNPHMCRTHCPTHTHAHIHPLYRSHHTCVFAIDAMIHACRKNE